MAESIEITERMTCRKPTSCMFSGGVVAALRLRKVATTCLFRWAQPATKNSGASPPNARHLDMGSANTYSSILLRAISDTLLSAEVTSTVSFDLYAPVLFSDEGRVGKAESNPSRK